MAQPDVVRITTARSSATDDMKSRQRRYLLAMGIRTVCFFAAVLVGAGVLRWVLVLAAVFLPFLAVVVAFSGSFVVNLLAFWLVEVRGIRMLYMIVGGLLSGLYLPVPWFPDWLRTIAQWSPFPSMLQNPVDLLAGRVAGGDITSTLAVQLFWAVALLGLGQAVLSAGRRRLEVQGG